MKKLLLALSLFFVTFVASAKAAQTDIVGPSGSGSFGNTITVLPNGNIVVVDSGYDAPGPIADVGAVYLYNGETLALISTLTGGTANDAVGTLGITVLTNGNFVVVSPNWNNPSPAISNVGAVTFCSAATGCNGTVSAANSLIGSTALDSVGNSSVTALSNGNYIVRSSAWDSISPAVANASAVTFGNGAVGTSGAITDGASGGNSVIGTIANSTTSFTFDATRNRMIVGRVASSTVSILSFTTNAIADGDLSNAANWSAGVPDGLNTGIIPNGRSMTISSKMNIGQIQVQCGGNLTGGSSSAYIVGSIRRDFCAASNASFTYPVGDPTNYSPMQSSGVSGTGSINVSATDGFMPGLPATAFSLSRYWSLEGSGVVSDLTFQYVDADVNGTEASYRVYRRPVNNNALITQYRFSSVNSASNTLTATSVSSYSDWSASAQTLAPTAAGASIAGRVVTNEGNGVRNAMVVLTDSNGNTRTAITSSFGYYRFDDLTAGESYILNISSKRYLFQSRFITLDDAVEDFDFIAMPY